MSENGHNRHHFDFADYRLYPHERLLTQNNVRVALTPRVMDLLIILVEHDGELVSKEILLSSIWKDSFVEEGNISRAVSTLRHKIGVQPNGSDFIETVPKLGYRFIAPVVHASEQVDKPVLEARKGWPVPMKWILGGVLVLLAVAAGLYFWRITRPVRTADEAVVRLTDDPGDDIGPAWTRDGRIRFLRMGKDHQVESVVIGADGRDQTPVKQPNDLYYGYWSPDGTKTVFAKRGDRSAFYLAASDGSNEISLPFFAGNFDWSSDSQRIVYQKSVDENTVDIFLYSIETRLSKNLTHDAAFDADPSFSPDGSQIVFASSRDGNMEIYLMNEDGSNIRRLTDHAAWENHPTFSPDGTAIAFNSDRTGENSDVYLMRPNGTDIRRLTDWPSDETVGPGSWSPDGTRLAITSNRYGTEDIFVARAEVFHPDLVVADDTSDLRFPSYSPDGRHLVFQAELPDRTGELRLLDTESMRSRVLRSTDNADILPSFSPDGVNILFQNKVESNTEVCLVNTVSGAVSNLTNNAARDGSPAWSPDGSRIVFASNRGANTGVYSLLLMNADGTDQHSVSPGGNTEGVLPVWSPEGDEIVFVNDPDWKGNFEIFQIGVKSDESEKQLTFRARYDSYPAFSPDGKLITFASNTDGNWEIYLMDRDGSDTVRLTRDPADDLTPHFSTDGKKIIFSSDRGGRFAIYEMRVF